MGLTIDLNARRERNERYGSHIAQARQWRLVAFLAVLILLPAIGGAFYFAQRSVLIPYVVEVAADGRTGAVSQVSAERSVDDRIIRATISDVLRDLRSVSADVAVQRRWVETVYAHLALRSPAYTAISEWFGKQAPSKRAEEETITVEVRQILTLSKNTYRVEWVEYPRARSGAELVPTRWSGTMMVGLGAVSAEHLLVNPLGIFITDRRIYHLRLLPRRTDYMPKVAFHYPNVLREEWQAYHEQRERNTIRETGAQIENLDFGYRILDYENCA